MRASTENCVSGTPYSGHWAILRIRCRSQRGRVLTLSSILCTASDHMLPRWTWGYLHFLQILSILVIVIVSPHRWTRSPAFLSNRCSIVSISRLSRFAEVLRSRTELTGECECGASVVPPRPLIGDVIQISTTSFHRFNLVLTQWHCEYSSIALFSPSSLLWNCTSMPVLLTANGMLHGD